jgi:superfamily II DNA/RNA helicase
VVIWVGCQIDVSSPQINITKAKPMPQKKKAPSWRPPTKRTSFQDAKKSRPRADGSRADSPDRGASAERPRYARPDGERPARSGRPDNERPRYPRSEGERPARAERSDSERPARSGRPETDRPRYARPDGERPARSGRPDSERPRYARPDTERPRYSRDGERPARSSHSGGDRPRTSDRPARSHAPEVIHDALSAIQVTADSADGVQFGDLGLGSRIVDAIRELGAPTPFALQAATIPVALSGRDVLGRGRTGSGKTIAFSAPLVERLLQMSKNGVKRAIGRAPRALILAPTRELALQIDRTVQPIARSVGLFTTQVYGGVPLGRQIGALERGVDIVIGTPGRIEDLIARGKLDVSQVVISVVDEADHMSELGFIEPLQRILSGTSPSGQRMLFSATLDAGVSNIVREFLKDPAVFEVAGENQESSTIDHQVWVVDQRDKREMVVKLAQSGGKTLMFARTRAFAEELADIVDDAGIPAVSLHGDLNQARRQRNLDKLTSGRVNVLVATDVAARGIHVDDIDTVVQVDPPDDHKSYVHRSGRTGRAGKAGTVITLTTRARTRRLLDLMKTAGISVEPRDMRPSDVTMPASV